MLQRRLVLEAIEVETEGEMLGQLPLHGADIRRVKRVGGSIEKDHSTAVGMVLVSSESHSAPSPKEYQEHRMESSSTPAYLLNTLTSGFFIIAAGQAVVQTLLLM